MPRRAVVDQDSLDRLLRPGTSVATHAELRAAGVPSSTISWRLRREGPWQRVLPGVVAGHRGVLTAFERRAGALAHAGPGAALTGLDALAVHGVRLGGVPQDGRVHVLVPHGCHRTSHGFAVLTRSRRTIESSPRRGLACVPPARAVVDACRRLEDLGAVRELVAAAVQQRACTVDQVAAEVRLAQRQRSALSRAAVAEVVAGVRSAAEAQLREGFARRGVPQPHWNAAVRRPDGEVLAVVDGLWEDLDAVLEIDSLAWHLSPAQYRSTQQRHRRLTVLGERAISVLPSEVHADVDGVCTEVLAFLRTCASERASADR